VAGTHDDARRWLGPALLLAAWHLFAPLASSAIAEEAIPREPVKLTPVENEALTQALKKEYPTTLADLKAIEARVSTVAEKVMPYTVGVRVGSAQGSGVIISEDGYVLTAGHVSGRPGREAVFTLHDGREVKGVTLGVNHSIDSGLMKITDDGPWPYAPMAEPKSVKPGEWVLSTGHPGGYMEGRTPVLRLGRILFSNDKVICTDCTLVGGDSGGPLFNLAGEVIGIHSRIGLQITTNFHVPIATYRETWDRLVAGEMWGRSLEERDYAEARPLMGVAGNRSGAPCEVSQVFPGSPAEQAGIREGDVITKFDGVAIDNFNELAVHVGKKRPGEHVPVEVRRGEQVLQLKVVLAALAQRLPGGRD